MAFLIIKSFKERNNNNNDNNNNSNNNNNNNNNNHNVNNDNNNDIICMTVLIRWLGNAITIYFQDACNHLRSI